MTTYAGSARLIWVDAFVALAAYGNYTEVAKAKGGSATTFTRRVEKLEAWLHLIL